MTLNEIMEWVDTVRPNPFTRSQKTAWINDLEASLWQEIFLRPLGQWRQKTAEDGAAPLLLPNGWRRLYADYLTAMTEFALGEFSHYENSIARYNATLAELGAWYAQEYDPATNPARWMNIATVTYSGGEAEPVLVGRLPRGAIVLAAECRIGQAFSPGCRLYLGTEEEPERFLRSEEIYPQKAGTYRQIGLEPPEEMPRNVYLCCEGDAPEQGQAALRLLIQLPVKGERLWK